jgi:hypothetical protein
MAIESLEPLRRREPVFDRLPAAFMAVMQDLEYRWAPLRAPYVALSSSFYKNAGYTALTLEQLFAAGKTTGGDSMFDGQGHLNPGLSVAEIQRAMDEQILRGAVIIDIGGVEAIPLWKFGADIKFVDKGLENTRIPCFEGMEFVGRNFDEEMAVQIGEAADVAMTSLVLSRASGLDPKNALSFAPHLSPRERVLYEDFLRLCLAVTKPGGINIHNGEAMFEIAGQVGDTARLIELHQRSHGDLNPYIDNIYVLRKHFRQESSPETVS